MRRIRTDVTAACLGLLLVSWAAPSHAQTAAERAAARAHFDRGLSLARAKAYAAALDEFRAAYAAVPHFSVLYNIGQAALALGRDSEARDALRRYLDVGAADVDPSRRAEVEALLARLEPPPSDLVPTQTPEPQSDVGSTLNAPPAEPASSSSAAPLPSAPPPTSPPASHAAPEPFTLAPSRAPSFSSDRGGSTTRARTTAYVLSGAAAVLGGVALGHYLWNRSRYERWQSDYGAYQAHPNEDLRRSTNELGQSISRASIVSVALCVGASLTLGTGVVLFVASRPSAEQGARLPDSVIGLRGSF